jgi:hypothetical protein
LYGAANLARILGNYVGARGIEDLEEEDLNHVMDINLKGIDVLFESSDESYEGWRIDS